MLIVSVPRRRAGCHLRYLAGATLISNASV